MDTDFLSKEAYNLIQSAGSFDDTLRCILGASAKDCKNEDEYLKNILEIIEEIKIETEEYLEDWGLSDQFSVAEYKDNLETLKTKIKEVMEIPEDMKSFEEW